MRVLLDTNVLVSAWLSRGSCSELLLNCRRRHRVVTCAFILEELRRTLVQGFGAPTELAGIAASQVEEISDLVEPAEVPAGASRDPKDAPVLGAALAGHCDCLVTGDKDLLTLGKFRGIPILSPREFWRFEAEFSS